MSEAGACPLRDADGGDSCLERIKSLEDALGVLLQARDEDRASIKELKASQWDMSQALKRISEEVKGARREYASANHAILAALGRLEERLDAIAGKPK